MSLNQTSIPVEVGQEREYLSGGKVYGRYIVGRDTPETYPYRPITWLSPSPPRLAVSLHIGAIQGHPVVER